MPTPHPMTLAREGTALLIVDVQERLFPAMDAEHREEVMRNIKVLAAAARRLHLPVVLTEQYPKGLGHTLRELRETLGPEIQAVPKVGFSCWAAVSTGWSSSVGTSSSIGFSTISWLSRSESSSVDIGRSLIACWSDGVRISFWTSLVCSFC